MRPFVPDELARALPLTRVSSAAGDAFNGAFATALMLGETPAACARFGAAAAAISVTRSGAQPSMQTLAEVQQILSGEGSGLGKL